MINWFSPPLFPQSTASLSGRLLDPSGAAIPQASLTLSNPLSRFSQTIRSSTSGSFLFTNIPFGNYTLTVDKSGFAPLSRRIALRSNVPVSLDLTLPLASAGNTLTVVDFENDALVHPHDTGSRVEINRQDIDRLSLSPATRGLETVLLTFPGFAQNANGAIHPRGAHNQMTFVVDGMPITDQLTGAFANAVDPAIVQTVELFTGNIPAEYGSKVAAVANVITRGGLGAGRILGGSFTLGADSRDTLSIQAQFSGEKGRLGYSASLSAMKTNRYLDPVSLGNLHNGGNLERAFSRFDYQPSDRDIFRLNLMAGNSSFQLANLPSQQANGMDQRQGLRDFSVLLGWVRTLTPRATWDLTASLRTATATLTPSAGDIPVTAAQTRRLTTATLWNRLNTVRGRHAVKAGVDMQFFPVSERFTFAVTNPSFNAPGSAGFIETLLAHDLSRGGAPFHFQDAAAGGLYSAFLQDNISLGRWNIALGLRYDLYRFLTSGNQFQPRAGISYYLRETGTVLRASYNRAYQTPPNENLLLASSEQSSVLVAPNVRASLGQAVVRIRPERQNFYEVGLQQAIGSHLSADASFYHKDARDQQDNNNFFNTGIDAYGTENYIHT
ncbi:MAG: TonB-dependent receptor, partial [Bryobacterales bacterium]|nr:TonB-dependent receptor [Bryobacterales bacterium]